jgi:hypothetical protein
MVGRWWLGRREAAKGEAVAVNPKPRSVAVFRCGRFRQTAQQSRLGPRWFDALERFLRFEVLRRLEFLFAILPFPQRLADRTAQRTDLSMART